MDKSLITHPHDESHGHFVSTDPELAAVDASVRGPVLACFLFAVHWLVVGTFLLVYASSLTHPQDTLPIFGLLVTLSHNLSLFTYGRVWPAAVDTLIYGWAASAGLGLAIWVLARTSRSPLRAPGTIMTGVLFWNLGFSSARAPAWSCSSSPPAPPGCSGFPTPSFPSDAS
jgi:cbb3-type cytochrome oxidase subunit 1